MVSLLAIWTLLLLAGATAAAAAGAHAAWGWGGAPRWADSPGVGVAGAALAAVAYRSLQALRTGTLVAVQGDCPACGEEVYAFLSATPLGGEGGAPAMLSARHACLCHVCSRPLAFDVRMRAQPVAPWRRRAHGRVYLAQTTPSDFFPEDE